MAEELLYKIVRGSSIDELQRNVRDAMRNDWTPQGGIAVDEFGFYQAMVPTVD